MVAFINCWKTIIVSFNIFHERARGAIFDDGWKDTSLEGSNDKFYDEFVLHYNSGEHSSFCFKESKAVFASLNVDFYGDLVSNTW